MKQLSSNYDGRPIDSNNLQLTINASDQEQFVVIRDGHVVGAASLSILPSSFSLEGNIVDQPTAWLASFIVHESYRGKLKNETSSIATQLWETVLGWAKKHGVHTLEFMTESKRDTAIHFYHHKGAEDVGTANLYHIPLKTSVDLTDVSPIDGAGIIYETCKTHLALHLYDHTRELTTQEISLYTDHAVRRGLSLMQYIVAKDSPAARSLAQAGIAPRREEIILRVAL